MGWSKLFGRREADAKAEPKAPPKPPPTPKPPEARAPKAPGRRLSNTSSKRPAGRSASKQPQFESVVPEVQVFVKDVQKIKGIEVIGARNVSRILLETIVSLPWVHAQIYLHRISVFQRPELSRAPRPLGSITPGRSPSVAPVTVVQVSETMLDEADCPSLFVAKSDSLEPTRPCLLRIGPRELLEEEILGSEVFREAYGEWAPDMEEAEIIGTMHKHSILVIPLTGGQCLMSPLALEPAMESIQCFTKSFADAQAANDGTEVPAAVSRALKATQHVCCSILAQPLRQGHWEAANLSLVFTNIEDLVLGETHPELGVDFYDGQGATAMGMEKELIDDMRGGPLTDGASLNDLNKMVLELVPGMKQTRPSQFLAWFQWQMQQTNRWNLQAYFTDSPAPIEFDAVLQDEDGHAFLVPCSANAQFPRLATLRDATQEDLKYRHVYARIARWMLSGVLLHTPILSSHDLKMLRELLMILAGMPEDLGLLPPPPPEGSPHLRFAWSFIRRCLRCLRWHHPMMPDGQPMQLPSSGLQLLFALLDAAVEMVASEHTRCQPERKRLALWASVCFAVRLAVEAKKMEEPGWLAEKLKVWGRFDDFVDMEGLACRVYVTRFGVQESWVSDPVSGRTRSVFRDSLPYDLLPPDDVRSVQTQRPELEDASFPMVAWRDLEQTMGRELCRAWRSHERLFITGGIGQSKRAMSRSLMADLLLEDVCKKQATRFPVRLSFGKLQELKDSADAIQEFMSYEPVWCAACSWERMAPPPWPGRLGHQVLLVEEKIFVIGGVSTQTGRCLQDVWLWQDGSWEELPTPPWAPRSGHQVVWWEDRLILLGGLGDLPDARHYRDAWTSSDLGQTWQELPCPKWSGRYGHQALVMSLCVKGPSRPLLLLMGGCGPGNKAVKDVWASDTGGYSWQELEALPCSPRWDFQLQRVGKALWITGGQDEHQRLNDCWVLNSSSWNGKNSGGMARFKNEAALQEDGWHGPFVAPWPARSQHQVIPFRGQFALFGGRDEKNQVLSDAWVSEDCVNWRRLPYHAWAQVSARAGHKVYLQEDGRSVICGGCAGGRDMLRSRCLAVVLEDIPSQLPQEVMTYIQRLVIEPGHLVACVSKMERLDTEGESPKSISAWLRRWRFAELQVKPLEMSHVQKLCRRWTHTSELREQVEAQMLHPDNYDLVKSPLTAMMVLRALDPGDRSRVLSRCQLCEHMFSRIFQSHAAVKAYDDSEFPVRLRLMRQGLVTACAELAYEGLGRRSRYLTATELQGFISTKQSEPLERLVKSAHAGQILLLEEYDGGLRFRYPSLQDYLAAQCAWHQLLEGKGLPVWLIKENATGHVTEEVTSCAKFFCLQAAGRDPLRKERLLELREGLAFLLQTMCKAGNALACQCLLGVAMAGGRQQLMAMRSHTGSKSTALHLAAIHGHQDVVEALLELAPEPMQLCTAVNAEGMTPLHCAARDGREATARALLRRAPDGYALLQISQKSSSALRPLHLAAKSGHLEVVKCFLEFAPGPTVLCLETNSEGNTALHFSAQGGHTSTTLALLSHAGPSSELSDRATLLLSALNRFDRQTALHLAADRGESEVVEVLISGAPERSVLLSMSDKLGQTALHLACEKGHASVVQRLLSSADRQLVGRRERITGQTALHMAAENGHSEAVRAVLEASPYRETVLATDRAGRNTALHLAAEKGHLETVKTLLEHAPNMEALLTAGEKFAGHTALHLAAGAGHAELCGVLLELAHGFAATLLGAKDKSGGFTPLQLACERGHANVVEVLLEGDPEKAMRLKETLEKWNGFTALHLIAYRGHEETCKVLLRLAPEKEALLALKDERGRTPAELAVERGRRPVPSWPVADLLAESES